MNLRIFRLKVKRGFTPIILYEERLPNDGHRAAYGNPDDLLTVRHAGRCNAAFVDCHVESITSAQGDNVAYFKP